MAITTKLILPEAMIYSAFVAIGYYSQPSYELGYAFKFMRIILLILTSIFNVYGFIAGTIIMILSIAFNNTLTGESYLYPVIPFNKSDFAKSFFRKKIQTTPKN